MVVSLHDLFLYTRILKGPLDLRCFFVTPSECDTSEGQAADRSRSAKLAGLQRVKASAPVFTSPPRQSGITGAAFLNVHQKNLNHSATVNSKGKLNTRGLQSLCASMRITH